METNPSDKGKMETETIPEELKSPCDSPLAKKRKRVHDDINVKTGFSRKEWQVVSILVELSAGNNMSLNNDVLNDYKLKNEPKSDLIYIDNEVTSTVDCPFIRNTINNNKTVDIEHLYTLPEVNHMSVLNIERLMANDPRFDKICLDKQNHFIHSRNKSYRFNRGNARSDEELHKKVDDFKYLINLFGSHLEALNVEAYPFSKIMPFINTNCPNLHELILQFKEIRDQDFENVFSNLSYLEVLRINWHCKNSTLPLTLVKSLEQVGGTLKELCLSRNQNQDHLCLPDSLASVFSQLITLKKLNIINFEPSQLLLQSMSEIENLIHLKFVCSWLNNHPVFDKTINMYPIGNLQKLQTFYINYDCGVTDEFLINLCNNAKNLRHFDIIGKNITDNGMDALNNLKELESLKFNLNGLEKNEFITDQSIQCFVHEKLEYLHLSNCIKITNKSVLKVCENSPNLNNLYVRNTKVTFDIIQEMLQITKFHKRPIFVYVSFKDRDDIFKLLELSGVFFQSNINTPKYIDILI